MKVITTVYSGSSRTFPVNCEAC